MREEYWKIQKPDQTLYEDILWNKPVRKDQTNTIGIIGGSKSGFMAVNLAYSICQKTVISDIKILVPDVLRKIIPSNIPDIVFVDSTPQGAIAKKAEPDIFAFCALTKTILLIGDSGFSSETGMLFQNLIFNESFKDKHFVITRDTIDLLLSDITKLLERENTTLVVTMSQLQKIFTKSYYPKIITFSMQLNVLVEILHKFTITYPINIVTIHRDTFIVASNGEVVTEEKANQMKLITGELAAKVTSFLSWNESNELKALATALK